jgi:hypothetical protein
MRQNVGYAQLLMMPAIVGGRPPPADIYELGMVKQKVDNQIVVAERVKAPIGDWTAHTTIMTGQIKHE